MAITPITGIRVRFVDDPERAESNRRTLLELQARSILKAAWATGGHGDETDTGTENPQKEERIDV